MNLRSIMTANPHTVGPAESLLHARDLMVWGGFRHLPVVAAGELVGLLSQRDVAAYHARTGESAFGNSQATVKMAMTSRLVTADPEADVSEAAQLMAEHKTGSVLVTEHGALLGLVTTTDVLAASSHQPAPEPTAAKVGDVMSRNPHSINPSDGLGDAAARMRAYHVRHLPVVDGDKQVVGMLSDRDIRAAIGNPTRNSPNRQDIRVSEVMTAPAVTIREDQSSASAAHLLARLSASALPVINANEQLVGVLSYVDLLRLFPE